MTKSLYPSLGNFDPASPPIIEVRPSAEELRAAYQRIDELETILAECRDYFDGRADADCDQDGFILNAEMKMLQLIDEVM